MMRRFKAALNKVLEDVPALKPQASGSTGFIQVGAASGQQQTQATDDALKRRSDFNERED